MQFVLAMKGRRGLSLSAVCLLALFAAPGCGYLTSRGRDFTDIISFGASSGAGIGARVGATRLIAVEVMAQKDEEFYGWRYRNFSWTESSYGLLFASFRMPQLGKEARPEPQWYDIFTTSRRRTHYPNSEFIEDRRHTLFIYSLGSGGRLIDALDLEVGVSFISSGVEIAVRPGELLDFFLGWFGLDLARDNDLRAVEITTLPGSPKTER